MNRLITVLFFFLVLPGIMLAGTTGKLKGKVTDQQSGEALIGANIIIVGTSYGAATDVNGEYTILNLNASTYEVRCSYIGYQAKTFENIRISSDLTTELNIQLAPEGITVGEVVVTAEKQLVNKSNTNAIRNMNSDDFQNLPVRGMNSLLNLTPGVIVSDNQVYVRGGRLDEVGFYLDGMSVTDPMAGGRNIQVSEDAVEEIQVQAGGYTAEFGGSNAGIIRQQLKTGGNTIKASVEYITDNLSFKGRDQRFSGEKTLGAYWFGYSEFIATLSGPLFSNKVKFFGLFSSLYQNDVNPQDFPGINLGFISDPNTPIAGDGINFEYPAGPTYKNSNQTYSGSGTLTFDFNPLIVRLSGTYSNQDTWDGPNFFSSLAGNAGKIDHIVDMDRVQKIDLIDYSGNLKLTYLINPTTFIEANAGFTYSDDHRYDPYLIDNVEGYGDSVANANVGWTWERRGNESGRFTRPANIQVFNLTFYAPGDVTSGYRSRQQTQLNFNASLSTEIGKQHSVKLGGELQMYTIRNYSFGNGGIMRLAGQVFQNDTLPAGDPSKLTRNEVYENVGVNNYGYTLFGDKYDGEDNYETGAMAPKEPMTLGIYVQDKIEYRNLIVNAGLRYDYIDTDNKELINPMDPSETIAFSSGEVDPAGILDVPTFQSISPRLGFSFPVTDQTVFHAQYGKFVQQTRLRDIYQGIYATGYNLRGGFFVANPVGFNVRPTRTTSYELGFTQQIGEFASFDITGYYKDIKDQVVVQLQTVIPTTIYQAYNVFTNGDFATTKGVEISFNMRRVERFQINGSISFQDARGTGSFPSSQAGIVGAPVDGVTIFPPTNVAPLVYNNALTGNISLDYRFGRDDGPDILHQFGVNALVTFASGHPFTRGSGKGNNSGSLEGDSRFRQPIEPLNASTTPSTFQVDLVVDKTFSLFEGLDANIYLSVLNLFDTRNILSVFLRTGTPDDDGYLSNPDLGGSLAEVNGPDYIALYNAINIDYYQGFQNAGGITQGFGSALMYGPPRQIRFGIRLEYQ